MHCERKTPGPYREGPHAPRGPELMSGPCASMSIQTHAAMTSGVGAAHARRRTGLEEARSKLGCAAVEVTAAGRVAGSITGCAFELLAALTNVNLSAWRVPP